MDSGATRSFISVDLWYKLGVQNFPQKRVHVLAKLADGRRVKCDIAITLQVTLQSRTELLEFCILPNSPIPCILGLNSLSKFNVLTHFATREWFFADSPENRFPFLNIRIYNENHDFGLLSLSDQEYQKLKNLLKQLIPPPTTRLSLTSLINHKIDVNQHPPIKQKFRRVSPPIYSRICKEVDKMLEQGVIEVSESDWSSPIVMVRKPNGEYRFCLDYREVNKVTRKDAYPLPRIEGILDRLRKAKFISTIDLSQAYHQVPMEAESKKFTTFAVEGKGLYQFTRMPYGLTNAPATFQRLIDRILGADMYPYVFCYLDDIIIVTETFEKHFLWLKKVLQRILAANLTINAEKSHLYSSTAKHLGFLVDTCGVHIDPDIVSPVLNYPVPKPVNEVHSFLGMMSWYRRFVPDLASLLEPLIRLLKTSQVWIWTDKQNSGFLRVKQLLTNARMLTYPDFSISFLIQTNASTVRLGAVITQRHHDLEKVIAFASRSMTEAERKWSRTEHECLAVYWAIKNLGRMWKEVILPWLRTQTV